MRLRIRYCGGCNPAYDRVKFVKSLVEELKTGIPGELDISFSDELSDRGILVCGCSTCCAYRDLDQTALYSWHIIGPNLLDYMPVSSEEIIKTLVQNLKGVSHLETPSSENQRYIS
jgi:hypothetical protein